MDGQMDIVHWTSSCSRSVLRLRWHTDELEQPMMWCKRSVYLPPSENRKLQKPIWVSNTMEWWSWSLPKTLRNRPYIEINTIHRLKLHWASWTSCKVGASNPFRVQWQLVMPSYFEPIWWLPARAFCNICFLELSGSRSASVRKGIIW